MEADFECPVEGRCDGAEVAADVVVDACSVADQVDAARGEQGEVDCDRVRWGQGSQVAADSGLVGEDRRVAGVGLAFTGIGACGTVHESVGEV